jgi:hypothetical protein
MTITDRLARAACPMAVLRPCDKPCHDCKRFAGKVALELVQVVKETHTRQEDYE